MTSVWLPKALKKWLRRPSPFGAKKRHRPVPARLCVEALEDRLQMSAGPVDPGTAALQQIDHFVVIYQENWSFDALYGNFPGANGIANASGTSLTQRDRVTGQPLTTSLPLYPGQSNDPNIPDNATTDAPSPYDLGQYLQPNQKTNDIVHRFWQEQSQIDHGAQDRYIGWSDNTQAVMSHFDATNLPEGLLAQQYTLDDNFFHAAFGGSFLNHQFLVSAAAPVYPNATTANPGGIATLGPDGQLALNPSGGIVHDGTLTPIGGVSFADPSQTFDKNYAINTIFSKNLAPDFIGNNTTASLLPSQNDSDPSKPNYIPTIGDTLDAANVSWKWYSGGWDNALASSPSNPANNGHTGSPDTADPNFQWHHQPLAYYDNFAPWLPNGQRNPLSAAHLQDENNFFQDLASNNLPSVSFIKQIGANNEHPGYTDLLQGQQATADLVHAIQNSPDWAHTAIIITYDENGGRWDHVSAPDANGIWGDGTRVPTIVISPYAKQGFVDHTQHDTLSILKTIEQRYNLPALNSYDANASSLASNFQAHANVSLGNAYVQPDADNPGKFTLIVQGTESTDFISVTQDSGEIHVTIRKGENGDVIFDKFFAQSISRMEVYGQGGNDHIQVAQDVTLPALIFAGDGNDKIEAGGGPTVEVGGSGNDTLTGGSGATILIGGAGEDKLKAGSGDTILIGGSTDFDTNAIALRALLSEWSRTDQTAAQKQAHLTGAAPGGLNELTTNTSYFLTATTVHDDQARDALEGGAGTDWFFAHLSGKKQDDVDGLKAGDFLTGI
jgi:phospholipase C